MGDLLKFAAFHLGDGSADEKRVLSAGALAEMQKHQVDAGNMAPEWGLGWWIQDASGTKTIGHGGSTNGHRALLTIVPERRFALAVLTNGSSGAQVGRQVERHLLAQNGTPRSDPEEGRLPAERMDDFAGRYHAPGGDVTLTVDGGQLVLDTWARNAITSAEYQAPSRRAVPIGESEFVIKDTDMEGSRFDFLLNADLSVRFLRIGGRLYDPV